MNLQKRATAICNSSFFYTRSTLFAFCFKCGTFRLFAFICISTSHLNLFGVTFAGMIVAAGSRITRYFGWFAWDVICIAAPIVFTLLKAFTTGLVCHHGIVTTHMNIVLTARVFFVVGTVYN